jgi:cytochrome c55X
MSDAAAARNSINSRQRGRRFDDLLSSAEIVRAHMKTLVLVGAAALLSVAPCFAEEAPPRAPAAVEGPDPQLAIQGKSLYAERCSHCHGFNMVNPGNYSYDLRQFPHDAKDRFVNSVLNGKNGRMPPWRGAIGTDEIDAIWAYVLTGGHI